MLYEVEGLEYERCEIVEKNGKYIFHKDSMLGGALCELESPPPLGAS